jgi:hypothetical protein
VAEDDVALTNVNAVGGDGSVSTESTLEDPDVPEALVAVRLTE